MYVQRMYNKCIYVQNECMYVQRMYVCSLKAYMYNECTYIK